MRSYNTERFKHGFLGKAEAHPLRRVQALLRARAAAGEAIERAALANALCDRLAALEAATNERDTP